MNYFIASKQNQTYIDYINFLLAKQSIFILIFVFILKSIPTYINKHVQYGQFHLYLHGYKKATKNSIKYVFLQNFQQEVTRH